MDFNITPVFFISVAIAVVYLFIIARISYGWLKLKQCSALKTHPSTMVSIIVPVRNEEATIKQCLSGLMLQKFPGQLLEILVVDDHSDDRTTEILREIADKPGKIRISVLSLTLAEGKKAAIQFALKFASGSLILCTDADCMHPNTWVGAMVNCFESLNPVFISGPVLLSSEGGFAGRFQEVEFMSLVASGAGAMGARIPIMCNGANLGFSLDAYRQLEADAMKTAVSSGDDVFLMLAMKKAFGAERISFVKSRDAVVISKAHKNPEDLIRQRLRWVSKSNAYQDKFLILTAVSVFLMNVLIVAIAIAAVFNNNFFLLFLLIYLWKLAVDFPLLVSFAGFAGRLRLIWFIPLAEPLVAVFTTFSAIAGNVVNIKWKGREVN